MKKNNNKLHNFWNKIKRPLMIFSLIGNVLFFLFIIVGCVGVKKQAQQTNAEDTNFRVLTLKGTSWRFNGFIQYTPTGHDLMTYRDYNVEEGSYTYTEGYILHYTIEGRNYTSGDSQGQPINFVSMQFASEYEDTYLSASYIQGFYMGEYGTQRSTELYHALSDAPNDEYYWNTLLPETNTEFGSVIHISEENVNNSPTENSQIIDWFYENATLITEFEPSVFTFANQINYNSPYATDLNSPFVSHYFADINELGFDLVYDLPSFISNNQVFNRIRLWYWNANGTRYEMNGLTAIYEGQNCAWYGFMQYINTNTNETIEVNSRTSVYMSDGYIVNSSTWVAQEYRTIVFQNELSPTQVKNLSQFNNSTYGSSFSGVATDVGLSNVFNILSSSFSSFAGIFAIQLLPGITIGLLFFMPLIVGLIITIIWLVKR